MVPTQKAQVERPDDIAQPLAPIQFVISILPSLSSSKAIRAQ